MTYQEMMLPALNWALTGYDEIVPLTVIGDYNVWIYTRSEVDTFSAEAGICLTRSGTDDSIQVAHTEYEAGSINEAANRLAGAVNNLFAI